MGGERGEGRDLVEVEGRDVVPCPGARRQEDATIIVVGVREGDIMGIELCSLVRGHFLNRSRHNVTRAWFVLIGRLGNRSRP